MKMRPYRAFVEKNKSSYQLKDINMFNMLI